MGIQGAVVNPAQADSREARQWGARARSTLGNPAAGRGGGASPHYPLGAQGLEPRG